MRSATLISMLLDSRQRTLQLLGDLTDEQLKVPLIGIVNPPVWEMGHVAWFQEKWALRELRGEAPVRADADALWDSIAIPHDDRWELPLPARQMTLDYMRAVLERVVDRLARREPTEQEAYFHWLVAMHEDMHGEAVAYTRQTLGYPAPRLSGTSAGTPARGEEAGGDVEIPGGTFVLGARPGDGFVFDNEKWAHEVKLAPFAVARTPVSNAQFLEFVADCGYQRRELWSEEGWQWREQAGAGHPVYWIAGGGGWLERRFDQRVPLEDSQPVIHVNWYEADAWCRWAGRRLPSEAEWELAAGGFEKREYPWGDGPPSPGRAHMDAASQWTAPVDALPSGDSPFGCRQMIGNVWEWTATDFRPYPGFVRDPYKEYSEPWFGSERKVLRGGCWVTRSRLIRNSWRNFFPKDRRDVFAGFRTCRAEA